MKLQAQPVYSFRFRMRPFSLQYQMEDSFHHRRGFLIYDPMPFLRRVILAAIGRTADVLDDDDAGPAFACQGKRRLHGGMVEAGSGVTVIYVVADFDTIQ